MRYVSTRGTAPALEFDDVLLAGLATDGGLYVPETWPALDWTALSAAAADGYAALTAALIRPFMAGSVAEPDLARLVTAAYREFRATPDKAGDIAPHREIEDNLYVLELFHGPTLAFKDYALQVVGRLFEAVLAARGRHITIIGATSGDTGSAAIEACRGRENIDIFILHPKGRVSEVQRRQMTTVVDDNVHNIAVEGTFDDCQDLVKAMFADADLRAELGLSAVNSINWARIMAQTAYYVWAGLKLGAPRQEVSFAVPTGNFGNVYAGYVAKRMGLAVQQLIVGTNRNDILARFFESGTMEMRPVEASCSPSMDIQVSSNFERLLFELAARDGDVVSELMTKFRESGRLTLGTAQIVALKSLFSAASLDDPRTLELIRSVHEETGYLLDPHSAVGVGSARLKRRDRATPMVALATAHPAKFPEAVEKATGIRPALPPFLADLFERPERLDTLPNDRDRICDFIRARVRQR